MKRFLRTLAYLLLIHLVALAFLSLFRFCQFYALRDLMDPRSYGHFSLWLPAFVRGLWFDNVVACYIMIVPLSLLLIAASWGLTAKWLRRAASIWFAVFYALVFATSAGNVPYFRYFFKNLDSSIFGWFGYAGTTVGMVTGESSYWAWIAAFLVVTTAFILFLRWWRTATDRTLRHHRSDRKGWEQVALRMAISAVFVGLCLFGIRGRVGYNPIKVSQAYYCNDPFLNQMGISPAFNLLTSTLDQLRSENRELHLMDNQEALSFVEKELGWGSEERGAGSGERAFQTASGDAAVNPNGHNANQETSSQEDNTAHSPLPSPRSSLPAPPKNIVIILMESMSASLLHQGITPTLDSLERHSLAFTQFFSAGIHTNHGMTATLYSYPALMKRNLMKGTVTPHRQGLPTVLHDLGYHNLFFMTHEAQYDNMNAFFRTNGYDEIYSQENYPKEERVNSFGVSDHFLFDFALPVLNQAASQQQPFMATLLTISNHPPYVIPPYFHPRSKEPERQIVEYADWALGNFLAKARQQPWYANTLFIVQADHGKLVGQTGALLPQSYNHIPLIIFGPGVANGRYEGLGMQVDVVPTVLAMLGLDCPYNGFGVNLMARQRDKVFYTSDSHIVGRDQNRCVIYEAPTQKTFYYRVTADGSLQAVAGNPMSQDDKAAFEALRHYAFAMIQTAEYLERNKR